MWTDGTPPRKPPTPRPPTRATIRQFGFRINETGVEMWFTADLQYGGPKGGGNGSTERQVRDYAEAAIKRAATLGVDLTYTLLWRDHLTTTWSRWLGVKSEEGS